MLSSEYRDAVEASTVVFHSSDLSFSDSSHCDGATIIISQDDSGVHIQKRKYWTIVFPNSIDCSLACIRHCYLLKSGHFVVDQGNMMMTNTHLLDCPGE